MLLKEKKHSNATGTLSSSVGRVLADLFTFSTIYAICLLDHFFLFRGRIFFVFHLGAFCLRIKIAHKIFIPLQFRYYISQKKRNVCFSSRIVRLVNDTIAVFSVRNIKLHPQTFKILAKIGAKQ